ncbi:MAG TPA: SCO family protein [Myxococcota bacterium]|nr:SCO family protein [Myxococcota bacterium]
MSADALPRASRRESRSALVALSFVLVVTAVWWAFALWPTRGAPPAWLARARWVCFDVGPSGLPDAAGWLLLVGQPTGLLLVLVTVWGGALREGFRELRASRLGRALIAASALVIAVGIGAAAMRVVGAAAPGAPEVAANASEPLPDTYPRLDRTAPELGLVDQRGERLDLARLRGRPAFVTFAFGHCETVCPLLVRDVVAAQRRVRESGVDAARVPRIAVVTLDPWRDTPSRLPALAQSWGLEAESDGFALSGPESDVNALLDRWNVPRGRNAETGQIDHPALVYVLDANGRIAYASTGDAAALADLVGRL